MPLGGPHGHDIPKPCNEQFQFLSSNIICFLQANLAHQHACICIPSILCSSLEERICFFLSRASRERGLGDGACVRVATVHNTSPSSLALNSSRDAHDRTNKCAPLHKQFAGKVFFPEGRSKGRSGEVLPEEQAKGLSRDPLRTPSSLSTKGFHPPELSIATHKHFNKNTSRVANI